MIPPDITTPPKRFVELNGQAKMTVTTTPATMATVTPFPRSVAPELSASAGSSAGPSAIGDTAANGAGGLGTSPAETDTLESGEEVARELLLGGVAAGPDFLDACAAEASGDLAFLGASGASEGAAEPVTFDAFGDSVGAWAALTVVAARMKRRIATVARAILVDFGKYQDGRATGLRGRVGLFLVLLGWIGWVQEVRIL